MISEKRASEILVKTIIKADEPAGKMMRFAGNAVQA